MYGRNAAADFLQGSALRLVVSPALIQCVFLLPPGGRVTEGGRRHLVGKSHPGGTRLHHSEEHRGEAELNLHWTDLRRQCRHYTGQVTRHRSDNNGLIVVSVALR